MNLDKFPEMNLETKNLIRELKNAYNKCWKAKIATDDIARQHAPICIRIMTEFLLDIPKLINNCIEERRRQIGGAGVFHPDFWANEDMIIALWEHIEREFDLFEDGNA